LPIRPVGFHFWGAERTARDGSPVVMKCKLMICDLSKLKDPRKITQEMDVGPLQPQSTGEDQAKQLVRPKWSARLS